MLQQYSAGEELTVRLGGHPHFVEVSGALDSRTIVLVCHGGPGFSEIGMVRAGAYRLLQERAVLVAWDQRGTARSFSDDLPGETMNVAQLVDDTTELAAWAIGRFGSDRVYMVGHSAGGALALMSARLAPALFGAVFALCPYVSFDRNAPIVHRTLMARAERCGRADALADLRMIGAPPFADRRQGNEIQTKWAAGFDGVVSGGRERAYELYARFQSIPGYTDRDYELSKRGQDFSRHCLFDDFTSIDLLDRVPALDVPIAVGIGRHDLLNCPEVTRQWFDAVVAPEKRFLCFEHSAHYPHFTEPVPFQEAVLQLIDDAEHRRRQPPAA